MGWTKGKPRRGEDREAMGIRVVDPTVDGVRTDDPRIRSSVQNMQKRGYDKDAMVKIIGVPVEIVEQHLRALAR